MALIGFDWSPDAELKFISTEKPSPTHPPAGLCPSAAGLSNAELVIALSARVNAFMSGVPGVSGVGAPPVPRAIAYASSRPALPANARLNAANDPALVLGPENADTALKPLGRLTGIGVAPAMLSCAFAESSSDTM